MQSQSKFLTLALLLGSSLVPAIAQTADTSSNDNKIAASAKDTQQANLSPEEQEKRDKLIWLQNFIVSNAGRIETGAILLQYPDTRAEFLKEAKVQDPAKLASLLIVQYEALVALTKKGTNNTHDGGKFLLEQTKQQIDAQGWHNAIALNTTSRENADFDELTAAIFNAIIDFSRGRLSPEVEIPGQNFLQAMQNREQGKLIEPVQNFFVQYSKASGETAELVKSATYDRANGVVVFSYIEWAQFSGFMENGSAERQMVLSASFFEADKTKQLEAGKALAKAVAAGYVPGNLQSQLILPTASTFANLNL